MVRAAAYGLERAVADTVGADALLDVLPGHLQRLVGCGPVFLAALDPISMHFVREGRTEITDDVAARFLTHEMGVPDVVKFRDLASAADPVDTLYRATAGSPADSARWREVIEPLGWGDELRVALRDAGRTWGVLCLHRAARDPAFSDDDIDAVRQLVPSLAGAFRRTALAAPHPDREAMPAPGVVILDDQLVITSVTGAAAAWLDLLGVGRPGLPIALMSAAARTITTGEPQSIAAATGDGRWISVHTSALHGPGPEAVAVVLQAAHPNDAFPSFAAAARLTPRETDVAAAVVRGLSDRAVARTLGLSEHTVQDHLKRVYAKTDVRSRTELIARLLLLH